jgi:tRNA 2-thiouridine synthesizing protein E
MEDTMTIGTDQIQRRDMAPDERFPHAPPDWTRGAAEAVARQAGLTLQEDHWEVVRALQEFFDRHDVGTVKLAALHDALEEKFHYKGGVKYLYTLLPGGPIAQGCRLAGLKPPGAAVDASFGSVA